MLLQLEVMMVKFRFNKNFKMKTTALQKPVGTIKTLEAK